MLRVGARIREQVTVSFRYPERRELRDKEAQAMDKNRTSDEHLDDDLPVEDESAEQVAGGHLTRHTAHTAHTAHTEELRHLEG